MAAKGTKTTMPPKSGGKPQGSGQKVHGVGAKPATAFRDMKC